MGMGQNQFTGMGMEKFLWGLVRINVMGMGMGTEYILQGWGWNKFYADGHGINFAGMGSPFIP